jgi:putative MATE family efflux protein
MVEYKTMLQTKENTTFKTFLKYLLPSMLAMVLMAVYTFTDTFVVGQALGSVALGAMGICTPCITITYALGFLFGIGGGSIYSIYMGKQDKAAANQIYSTALLALLILGVGIAIVTNIWIEPFAYFLGADDGNIAYVLPYLRCVLLYVPGFMLDIFVMCFMKNDGHPEVAMMATVSGTALNVVLDLLFVMVFGMGMAGAAIATCIGSAVCIVINMTYSTRKRLNILPVVGNIRLTLVPRIFKNGLSVFVLESSSGIVTLVFIMQATRIYGTIGSSIYTIIMNWSLICFNLLMGVAQSVQPLISVNFGANAHKAVRTYRRYAIVTSVLLCVLFLAIGYGFTDALVSVFATDSAELLTQSGKALRLYLPAFTLMGIGISIGIYFQSVEAALKSFVIMTLRGMILPIAGALLLSAVWGGTGLWVAVPLAECITAVAAVIIMVLSDKAAVLQPEPVQAAAQGEHQSVIITISREFGSGGRAIGRAVANTLGIPFYDKEVSDFTEACSGYDAGYIAELEDKSAHPLGLYAGAGNNMVDQNIFLAQCKVINDLAAKGACVIVGRCADYVLHGNYRTVNVFVHAPLESRVRRIVEYEHCTEKQAVKLITESDRARAAYHDLYTGMEWGKSQNYDIAINSHMGFDKAVEMIVNAAQA